MRYIGYHVFVNIVLSFKINEKSNVISKEVLTKAVRYDESILSTTFIGEHNKEYDTFLVLN